MWTPLFLEKFGGNNSTRHIISTVNAIFVLRRQSLVLLICEKRCFVQRNVEEFVYYQQKVNQFVN